MSPDPALVERQRARAEAGAWLARLRSELRTPADEAGFQAWLAQDAHHRDAFAAVTSAFEAAGAVAAQADASRPAARFGRRELVAAGAAAAIAGAGGLIWRSTEAGLIRTGVGQMRRTALADGSQVMLDTLSVVRVRFSSERRLVQLLQGRARFEVAKDVARPFIVSAGAREVIALGTVFTVSRVAQETSVFLEEGRVVVRDVADGATDRPLAPGDRLVFAGASVTPVRDRPASDLVSAWQTGRAYFDGVTLAEAVAEMNRYNRRRIEVADPAAAGLRLSGVFRTGDPDAFAQSVALLLPVAVEPQGDGLVLRSRESRAPG